MNKNFVRETWEKIIRTQRNISENKLIFYKITFYNDLTNCAVNDPESQVKICLEMFDKTN